MTEDGNAVLVGVGIGLLVGAAVGDSVGVGCSVATRVGAAIGRVTVLVGGTSGVKQAAARKTTTEKRPAILTRDPVILA